MRSGISPTGVVADLGDPGSGQHEIKVRRKEQTQLGCDSWGRNDETNLVYRVDSRLSIVSTEAADHLDLIPVREDRFNKGDGFVGEEFMTAQTLPGWYVDVEDDR